MEDQRMRKWNNPSRCWICKSCLY